MVTRKHARRAGLLAGALAIAMVAASASQAADIIAEWATVKVPPAPELKPVTLQGPTTALLIMDLMKAGCGSRPRCGDTVPVIKRLHDKARAAGAMVFYTLVGQEGATPAAMVDGGFAPRDGEWVFQRGPDKFLGSPLEERLKAKGIKTVIVCGTSAQGVGLGTGSAAAQRGYDVVVPVDCLSSDDAYLEQYTAWHMAKGGPAIVTSRSTLTKGDMIKF